MSSKNFREMTVEEFVNYDLTKIGGEFIVGRQAAVGMEHTFLPRVKFYTLADAVNYCIVAEGGIAEHQIFEACRFETPNFYDNESIEKGYNSAHSQGWAGFDKSGVIFWKGEDFMHSQSLPFEARVRVEKAFSSVVEAVRGLCETSYSAKAVFEYTQVNEFADLAALAEQADHSWNDGDSASFSEGYLWYSTPSIEFTIERVEQEFQVILAYGESLNDRLDRISTMKSGWMFKEAVGQGWELKIPVGIYFTLPNEWDIKAAHPELNPTEEETEPAAPVQSSRRGDRRR